MVRTALQKPGWGTRERDVQSWLTIHQVFCPVLKLHDEHMYPDDAFAALADIMFVGKARIRPPLNCGPLLVTASVMRAYRK